MKQLLIALLFIGILGVVFFIFKDKDPGLLGDVHEHADFKVYLNNEEYNFSQEKYMSKPNNSLSNFIHLHDMDGNIIHKHAQGINLGFFFESLGVEFNSTCFVLDNGTNFCNNEKTLKMFINGKLNNKFEKYEFKDLDKILITYGDEEENFIKQQIGSVTDKACIQSGKCPERGEPSNESTCLTEEGCAVENA